MGTRFIEINFPVSHSDEELRNVIKKIIGTDDFDFQIDLKSLDARNKRNIHWKMRIAVISDAVQENSDAVQEKLTVPHKHRDANVVVVGSGPAGFFAAYILQKAGYDVTIIERGTNVENRSKLINNFEANGHFSESGNYAYGEGGAGTFSDGKLTSRTKNIHKEKDFVIQSYVDAGAPKEIVYLSSPHIGTNNLIKVVKNLRNQFEHIGGKILFDTKMIDLNIIDNMIKSIETDKGTIDCNFLFIASGHSSFDTFRMLIKKGVAFKTKPFAIGVRAEHSQETINKAQWGKPTIKGLKAAEYKLTFKPDNLLPVYSFCMCPGGKVVPAAPNNFTSVVNGMSYYARNSKWANAAIVAGINLPQLLGKEIEPLEAIDWLENLEAKFFNIRNSFDIPAVLISDFIKGKSGTRLPDSSYPFALFNHDYQELFPNIIIKSLQKSLLDFSNKIKGYEEGVIMGLESKTSSPIQAIRNETFRAVGFENLFIIGEGSGHSGGIISSAVDGVKSAMTLAKE